MALPALEREEEPQAKEGGHVLKPERLSRGLFRGPGLQALGSHLCRFKPLGYNSRRKLGPQKGLGVQEQGGPSSLYQGAGAAFP